MRNALLCSMLALLSVDLHAGDVLDDALLKSAETCDAAAAGRAIAAGANVDCKERGPFAFFPATPLQVAIKSHCLTVVELVVSHGADVQMSQLFSTPLESAVTENEPTIVAFLLKHGANPNTKHFGGDTVLTSATEQGLTEVLRVLLENGASPGPSLLRAASGGNIGMVKVLLDYHASLEEVDRERNTALILAAREGHETVVKALVAAGADVNQPNARCMTALDVATDHERIAEFLRPRTDSRIVLERAVAILSSTPWYDDFRKAVIARAIRMSYSDALTKSARQHYEEGLTDIDSPEAWRVSSAKFKFEQTINEAPWYAPAYRKAAAALMRMAQLSEYSDNRRTYEEAAKDLEFSLVAKPDASDAAEVRELKLRIEQKARTAKP